MSDLIFMWLAGFLVGASFTGLWFSRRLNK